MKLHKHIYPECAEDGSVCFSDQIAGVPDPVASMVYRQEMTVEKTDFEDLWEPDKTLNDRDDYLEIEALRDSGAEIGLRFHKPSNKMFLFASERFPGMHFVMPKTLAPSAVFDSVTLYPFKIAGTDSYNRVLITPLFEIFDYKRMRAEYSPGQSIECVVTSVDKENVYFHHNNFYMLLGLQFMVDRSRRYSVGDKIRVCVLAFDDNNSIVKVSQKIYPTKSELKLPDADLGLTIGQICEVSPVGYSPNRDYTFMRYKSYKGIMFNRYFDASFLDRHLPLGVPIKARLLEINEGKGLIWASAEDWAIEGFDYDKIASYINGRDTFPATVVRHTNKMVVVNCGGCAFILLREALKQSPDHYALDTVVMLRVVSNKPAKRKMHLAEVGVEIACDAQADNIPAETPVVDETHIQLPTPEEQPQQPTMQIHCGIKVDDVVTGVASAINNDFLVIDYGDGTGLMPLKDLDLSFINNKAEIIMGLPLKLRCVKVDKKTGVPQFKYERSTKALSVMPQCGDSVNVHVLAKFPYELFFEWSGNRIGHLLIEHAAATQAEYDSLDIDQINTLVISQIFPKSSSTYIKWKYAPRYLREYPFPEGTDTDTQRARLLDCRGDVAVYVTENNGWIVRVSLKNMGGKYGKFHTFAKLMDKSDMGNLPVSITFKKNPETEFGYHTEVNAIHNIRDYRALPDRTKVTGIVIGEHTLKNSEEYYIVDLGDWLGAIRKKNFAWRMGQKELDIISQRKPIEFYKMNWIVRGQQDFIALTRMGIDIVEMTPGESYNGTLESVHDGMVSVKLDNGYTVWCEYDDIKKDTSLLSPLGDNRLMMGVRTSVVFVKPEIGQECRLLARRYNKSQS